MGKIVRHSYGIKQDRDVRELNRMAFDDRRKREDIQAIMESNKRIAAIESRDGEERFIRNTLDRDVLNRKALQASNAILEQGKLYAFKSIMTNTFRQSLVMDDYFVKENAERFDDFVSQYIDRNGGFAMLENAIKDNPIPLLVEMKKVCEQTAHTTTKRIIKEMSENPELANVALFEMNEEEKDEFYKKTPDLSMDKLAELVKNKVLTVVKDERDRQSKQKELMDDLEAKAKEAAENGEQVKESVRHLGEPNLKESTLFNAIFHNSYKETLESMSKEHYVPDYRDEEREDDEEYEDFDVAYTKDDMIEDTPTSDEIKNPLVRDVDLDLILTESITYYTLLELSHTMCLETFNRRDIQNLSHKLLNGK